MPPKSAKQKRFFGADYGRAKVGKPTRTGLGAKQLRELLTGKGKGK